VLRVIAGFAFPFWWPYRTLAVDRKTLWPYVTSTIPPIRTTKSPASAGGGILERIIYTGAFMLPYGIQLVAGFLGSRSVPMA